MPPVGAAARQRQIRRVARWLEAELDRAAAAHVNPGRTAEFHRLNRTEYTNAVRDLIGIKVDGAELLPPDEQAYGFDTNADALSMQPALLDRYLLAATKIARLAVGDPTIPPGFERYTALKDNSNERRILAERESRRGISARVARRNRGAHYFPLDGEYVVKIRLEQTIGRNTGPARRATE